MGEARVAVLLTFVEVEQSGDEKRSDPEMEASRGAGQPRSQPKRCNALWLRLPTHRRTKMNRRRPMYFRNAHGAQVLRPGPIDRPLHAYDFVAANAGVRGKDDTQRVDRSLVMLGQVDLATDGAKKQSLLALAELLVARLVLGREEFVGFCEAAVQVAGCVMDAERVGLRMRVMVR